MCNKIWLGLIPLQKDIKVFLGGIKGSYTWVDDVYNLSQSPNYIEENLETKSVITWIKGPFAKALITNKSNNKWVVVENPTYLDKHIVRNNFVITLYSIFF